MGRKTFKISSICLRVGLALAVIGNLLPARDAAAAPLSLADCFTIRMRQILETNGDPTLARFDERVAQLVTGRNLPEVEKELALIVDEFAAKSPDFPRGEFLDWMKKHPMTSEDLQLVERLRASKGDVLNARFEGFRLQRSTNTLVDEVLTDVKNVGGNQTGLKKVFAKRFPCLSRYPVHITAMASSFAVQVTAYGIMAAQGGEFSYDLLLTNTIFNAVLGEKLCKEVEDMNRVATSQSKPQLGRAEMNKQLKNYFFGKANTETGLRPGLAKTMFDRQMKYLRYSIPYAGTYGVLHAAQGSLLHGKTITFKPLSEIPERERNQYVSLNPIGIGKDAVVNMLLYDIPFSTQRNIFLMDPVVGVMIPNLLKKTVPIFVVQSGARTASTYYSTLIFRCWEEDKMNIYGCIAKVFQKEPELKAVVVPDVPAESGVEIESP